MSPKTTNEPRQDADLSERIIILIVPDEAAPLIELTGATATAAAATQEKPEKPGSRPMSAPRRSKVNL